MLNPDNVEKQQAEKVTIEGVKFWNKIDCYIARQKSRIRWLEDGDMNSKYFHATVKDKNGTNRIDKLINDQGVVLNTPNDIQHEILSY